MSPVETGRYILSVIFVILKPEISLLHTHTHTFCTIFIYFLNFFIILLFIILFRRRGRFCVPFAFLTRISRETFKQTSVPRRSISVVHVYIDTHVPNGGIYVGFKSRHASLASFRFWFIRTFVVPPNGARIRAVFIYFFFFVIFQMRAHTTSAAITDGISLRWWMGRIA